jgi:histidine triad (HIT) family protein
MIGRSPDEETPMPTIFEQLLSGALPCAKVYEDDLVFAFMDAGQVNDGHVIVATRAPRETLLDCTEDEAAALMRAARRIALALQAAFAPDGITVLQTNRPAGWQTVPHVHLHVLPRHVGDAAGLVWPRREPGMDRLRELAAQVTAALQQAS